MSLFFAEIVVFIFRRCQFAYNFFSEADDPKTSPSSKHRNERISYYRMICSSFSTFNLRLIVKGNEHKMNTWSLVKKDDRHFINPFLVPGKQLNFDPVSYFPDSLLTLICVIFFITSCM